MEQQSDKHIFGLILAAGSGERMGDRPKALLHIDGGNFLQRIADKMRIAGLLEIKVVVGYHREKVLPYIPRNMEVVINPDPENDMLSSILVGIAGAKEYHTGALIAHVDYPLVETSTFRALIEEHYRFPGCIISPVYKGRGGHPVIFPRILFEELADAPLDIGARHVVRANPDRRRFVPVDDPGIAIDINTPEDYEKYIGPFPGE
ncbi:nucleotidyltransferase family protein [bacterium]|nr:MAG: nucleotidyltransferase family protein [bacterium]